MDRYGSSSVKKWTDKPERNIIDSTVSLLGEKLPAHFFLLLINKEVRMK